MRWLTAVLFVASCASSQSFLCPDGVTTCPPDTMCLTVTKTGDVRCASESDRAPCAGKVDGDACTLDGQIGLCDTGVCLPFRCGDAFVDPGEVCDDGNNINGDGTCSADCSSLEVCGNDVVDPVQLDDMGKPQPNEICDDGDQVAHNGCSSLCQPENATWTELSIDAPSPRVFAAATYDAARGRAVLVGGTTLSDLGLGLVGDMPSGDTWSWDGRTWQRVPTTLAPSPRYGHTLTYDPSTRQIVLFGGSNGLEALGDTWILEGDSWRQATPTASPPARVHAASAYLPGLGVVLFGGYSNELGGPPDLDDTWRWDGSQWTPLVTGTHPEARAGALLVLDPTRGVLVLAGGVNGPLSTWERSVAGWTLVAPAASSPVGAFAAAAYDPYADRVLTFGGQTQDAVADVHGWNGTAWADLTAENLIRTPRLGVAGFVDPSSGRFVTFGGTTPASVPCGGLCSYDTVNEMFLWNRTGALSGTWNDRSVSLLAPRVNPAISFDETRREILLYGGSPPFAQPSAETWRYDGHGWRPVAATGPSGRTSATMAYDRAHDQFVLHGGKDATSTPSRGDTWILDAGSDGPWTSVGGLGPSPRIGHAMAYDARRGHVVLFGGDTGTGAMLDDLWEWDGSTWQPIDPPGPRPDGRRWHTLVYDPVRERVLLFGGDRSGVQLRDVWAWDGTSWSERTPATTITSRKEHGLAWNPARQRLTLFGGASLSVLEDTFELTTDENDEDVWQPVALAANPGPHRQHVMAPSPDGSGVVMFGGQPAFTNSDFFSDTWLLSSSSGGRYEDCRAGADDDGDGARGCDDSDCWAFCAPFCGPGVTCDMSAPRCGDLVCNGAIENVRNCPADCTRAPLCGDFYCDTPETMQTCPGDCTP